MPQNDLQEKLHEAFKSHQERARDRARQNGKTEVTQEEYKTNPIVRLARVYEDWADYYHCSGLEERIKNVQGKLSDIPLTLSDMSRFHEIFPHHQHPSQVEEFPYDYEKEGIKYLGFMFALAKNLKSRQDCSSIAGAELHPFFEPQKLLPQVAYLDKHSVKARIKFEGLDTVTLTACESACLDNFDAGNLAIDVESEKSRLSMVGYGMKSGYLFIMPRVRVTELGIEMKGGTIIYGGNIEDVNIGERMNGGAISLCGSVTGNSQIGHEMKKGDIYIGENVELGQYTIYHVGDSMSGGTINIGGSFINRSDQGYSKRLGSSMQGGLIIVTKGASGNVTIGDYMKGGYISIRGDCLVKRIGDSMNYGCIEIEGDAGLSIGSCMRGGTINVGKNVVQRGHEYGRYVLYSVGSHMDGGLISIGCNVDDVGDEMKGGVIRINGHLSNKTEFVQLGGHIYERGVEIHPNFKWRLLSGFARWAESLEDRRNR